MHRNTAKHKQVSSGSGNNCNTNKRRRLNKKQKRRVSLETKKRKLQNEKEQLLRSSYTNTKSHDFSKICIEATMQLTDVVRIGEIYFCHY